MNLKASSRNVLIQIELGNKKLYKFASGEEIVIMKGFEFNLRLDNPSIGKVVDGCIPKDAICLIHHNSSHDSYKIFGLYDDEGKLIENMYSVPEDMLFCYKEEGKEWCAMKDFLITLRLYKPYTGLLTGIESEQIKQRLYVVSGKIPNYEVEKKVVIVTKHSDYEIIFLQNGREKSLIRTRSRELLGIDYDLTDKLLSNKILIGNNLQDAREYTNYFRPNAPVQQTN